MKKIFNQNKVKRLLLAALNGNAKAYRNLAKIAYSLRKDKEYEKLTIAFLDKAIELYDEKSYFLKAEWFPESSAKTDGKSLEEMKEEIELIKDARAKKILERHIRNYQE